VRQRRRSEAKHTNEVGGLGGVGSLPLIGLLAEQLRVRSSLLCPSSSLNVTAALLSIY